MDQYPNIKINVVKNQSTKYNMLLYILINTFWFITTNDFPDPGGQTFLFNSITFFTLCSMKSRSAKANFSLSSAVL